MVGDECCLSFSPIKQFCGEAFISLPNTCSGDQSRTFRDISLFVLHAVWPLVKGLMYNTVEKTHFTHLKSSVVLLWVDLRPFGWPEKEFFVSFSLFDIYLPLEVDFFFSFFFFLFFFFLNEGRIICRHSRKSFKAEWNSFLHTVQPGTLSVVPSKDI